MNVIEVGFRIRQAIGLTGLSVKEFCEQSKRSRVTTALWIAGRGGVIKETSLDELCYDLKQFKVICNKRWLISGEGVPPTLSSRNPADNETERTAEWPAQFCFDFTRLRPMVAEWSGESYKDYQDSSYYCISSSIEKTEIKKKKWLHLLFGSEAFIGTYEGLCKQSQTLIIKTMSHHLQCIQLSEIDYVGEVIFMIRKSA